MKVCRINAFQGVFSPLFQIPHQKSELFSVTDHYTATSSTHLSLFEQLVSSDTCNKNAVIHRAVETLHDIYPQQDKSRIESVLQSFDYAVSEAVYIYFYADNKGGQVCTFKWSHLCLRNSLKIATRIYQFSQC